MYQGNSLGCRQWQKSKALAIGSDNTHNKLKNTLSCITISVARLYWEPRGVKLELVRREAAPYECIAVVDKCNSLLRLLKVYGLK